MPSYTPSETASAAPSYTPSALPSYMPSYTPTGLPSYLPTISQMPTSEPSSLPTTEPTISSPPSVEPSFEPSLEPSAVPSSYPSDEPTFAESGRPTFVGDVSTTLEVTLSIGGLPDEVACSEELEALIVESLNFAVCSSCGLVVGDTCFASQQNGVLSITTTDFTCPDDSSMDMAVDGITFGGRRQRRQRRLHGRRLEIDADFDGDISFTQTDADAAGVDTSGDFAGDISSNLDTALQQAESDPAGSTFFGTFTDKLVEEIDAAGGEVGGLSSAEAGDVAGGLSVTIVEDDDDDDDDDDGLSQGALIGIIVGASVAFVAVLAAIYLLVFSDTFAPPKA
eukprot:scaffold10_cov257-Pinguiococcus_pyrenoidosus.AAC.65